GSEQAAGLEGEVVVGQGRRQRLGRYVEHVHAEGPQQVGGGPAPGERLLGSSRGVHLVQPAASLGEAFQLGVAGRGDDDPGGGRAGSTRRSSGEGGRGGSRQTGPRCGRSAGRAPAGAARRPSATGGGSTASASRGRLAASRPPASRGRARTRRSPATTSTRS